MLKSFIIAVVVITLIGTYSIYAESDKSYHDREEHEEYEEHGNVHEDHEDFEDEDDEDFEDEDDEDEDEEDDEDEYEDEDEHEEYENQYDNNGQLNREFQLQFADQQQSLTLQPVYAEGFLLAPAKELMQVLDVPYIQYENNGILELFAEGKHLVFRINKPVVYVDGKKLGLASQPTLLDGAYYLPLEAFLDQIGFRVTWMGDQSTLLVSRR